MLLEISRRAACGFDSTVVR